MTTTQRALIMLTVMTLLNACSSHNALVTPKLADVTPVETLDISALEREKYCIHESLIYKKGSIVTSVGKSFVCTKKTEQNFAVWIEKGNHTE